LPTIGLQYVIPVIGIRSAGGHCPLCLYLYIFSYISKMVNFNRNTPASLVFLGSFTSSFLLLCIGALLLIATIHMVYRWCTKGIEKNAFEPFTNSPSYYDSIQERIASIRDMKRALGDGLDDLDDSADETCDIMRQVEDIYVSNNSAPNDASEYNLPQSMQDARMGRRKKRAEASFTNKKHQYSAIYKVAPVYECFNGEEDIVGAEEELRTEILDVERIIDTAEMKGAVAKGEQVSSLLGFNATFLKRGIPNIIESFANSTKNAMVDISNLSGPDLLAYADQLIGKGATVREEVSKLKAAVATQKMAAKALTNKSADLQRGDIRATDTYMAMSIRK